MWPSTTLETTESVAHLVDQVLDLLNDGKWHSEGEILRITHIPPQENEAILAFLSKLMFIEKDEEGHKARIKQLTEEFWHKL